MSATTQSSNSPSVPALLAYGPEFPKFRMMMEGGEMRFKSRTNHNLRLTPDQLTADGSFTMGNFLTRFDHEECRPANGSPICSMVASSHWGLDDDEHFGPIPGGINLMDLTGCAVYQRLRGMCRTEPQRVFYDRYIMASARSVVGLAGAMDEYLDGRPQPDACALQAVLFDLALPFPALIPEVWLNYLGPDKTDQDRDHLAKNPSCVDFVMITGGEKWVIEIDGPSHYADWIESTRKYAISQERYTKNLRIERSLELDHGWRVRRFSDHEVTTTPVDQYWDRLLRYIFRRYQRFYLVRQEHIVRAMDDVLLPF